MFEVVRSSEFSEWLAGLRDREARTRILARLVRMQAGNPGDAQPVGEGVSELRVHAGPGYRIYFIQSGSVRIVLLCGGDKSTQAADIIRAKMIAKQWRTE